MKQGFLVGVVTGALALAPLSVAAQTQGGQAQSGQPSATKMAGGDAAARSLGSVRLTRSVKANGEVLPPGRYQVRLTEEVAKPEAPGTQPALERWVEFLQGGQVKGREVVSIVPQDEIAKIAESRRVPAGSSRVEMLKGNDYVRVWINRGGTHYLIHMPPA
jgi:hypothetical protein